MVGLNYFLLKAHNNIWIWTYVCIGVAVGALLLIPFCRRLPKMDRAITAVGARILITTLGAVLVYGGVSFIREHRLILKDDVRVVGVVTYVRRSSSWDEDDRGYSGLVVYTDERGRRHESRTTWSEHEHPFVGMKVPVIYYRPNPDLAIVDPSWIDFVGPWFMMIAGSLLLIFGLAPLLSRAKRLIAGLEHEEEELPQDGGAQQAGNAEGRFRLACREVLADGKATIHEKHMLETLAKQFELSNQAAKRIVRDEVRIFRRDRKGR